MGTTKVSEKLGANVRRSRRSSSTINNKVESDKINVSGVSVSAEAQCP